MAAQSDYAQVSHAIRIILIESVLGSDLPQANQALHSYGLGELVPDSSCKDIGLAGKFLFNSEVLFSTEHVTLGQSYSVGLYVGEKRVSLRVGGSSTVLRIAAENEAVSELSIGRHRKSTFNGIIVQLLIDGEAVRPENLVPYSDLWSLYSAPLLLGGDDYIRLPDVKPQPGPRIDVSLSVNRTSEEGSSSLSIK
ncbi:unnamed protein product [Heligmosomoides polygyrus]|uniref:DUF1758 domain-containing protein n=1 Tax=Heligmosomoides polygyrus TaxID=6339 RepID=A0A183F4I9_HELPZ|nr:unnamed protein product [Heligmosomoides polygyrus]